ncbi:hypothetical protein [Fluviispira multicolorata]|uniref:hypothetical protein n=1 Tax=Fluviispira multicolorata TaxID=2654512 RepID=UPI0013755531|nr:hypothetical protein [Fluviispira multicolorata]
MAHSGTAIGIILDITDVEYNSKKAAIIKSLNKSNIVYEVYRSTYSKIMSYDI